MPSEDRGVWGNQVEFLLACVGYAVGIGNVWRFPYLTFKNGGGAFLIPYFISLAIAALPLFYLELCLGQYSGLGPGAIFKHLCPILEGVGWGMVVVSLLTAIYYIMLIAYSLVYFVLSFRAQLLWDGCDHEWNTFKCWSNLEYDACVKQLGVGAEFYNKTCWNATMVGHLGLNATLTNLTKVSPAEEFWENYILNVSGGFENIGGLQWHLVAALAGAWLIVFLCLCKGVQSTGKAVYFTATFPYVVLVILLIRGVTLPGAGKGLRFYLTPDLSQLLKLAVWRDAAVQIFYSLGPAFGVVLTMSSYSRFNNNCYRDALIVAGINSATSVFAGFAVFAIAGFMSDQLGLPVEKVVRDGTGLAFIAYPEAMVRMAGSPIWSALFFFMLLLLGLDSQFAFFETPLTALMDSFPQLRKRKTLTIFLATIVFFIAGLPLCTRGGMYIFILFNDYSAGYCLIILGVAEAVTVTYIYGFKNLSKDIQLMIGARDTRLNRLVGPTGLAVRVALQVFSPTFLMAILVASFFFYEVSSFGDYVFPAGAQIAGWCMSLTSIACLPAFAIYRLIRNRLQNDKPLSDLWKSTHLWKPSRLEDDDQKIEKQEKPSLNQVVPIATVSNGKPTIPQTTEC